MDTSATDNCSAPFSTPSALLATDFEQKTRHDIHHNFCKLAVLSTSLPTINNDNKNY